MEESEDWVVRPHRPSALARSIRLANSLGGKSFQSGNRRVRNFWRRPLTLLVNKQIPNYLRLVSDTSLQPRTTQNEDLAALDHVSQSFARATGWQLEYAAGPPPSVTTSLMWSAPVDPGVGTSPGHIRLLFPEERKSSENHAKPSLSLEQAAPLAEAIGQLWGEVLHTRHALRQREAELAAGVPLVVRDDDARAPSLAERLESVLKGGAEAIGCQAAALYLLDDATSELKLRSSWGLPRRRLADPARPLRRRWRISRHCWGTPW